MSANVRNIPKAKPKQNKINIGSKERWTTGVLGAGFILFGLKKISWRSVPLIATGGLLLQRASTGHCGLYEKLDIDHAMKAKSSNFGTVTSIGDIKVEEAVAIMRPANEIFSFWSELSNLPKFMSHLQRVEILDENKSRWSAKAPLGLSASWVAEIISKQENERIEWKSTPESWIKCSGSVTFKTLPHNHGTEVRVRLQYHPPFGKMGHQFAKLFRDDPRSAIRDDLRSLRALLETGEIPFGEAHPKSRSKAEAEKKDGRSLSL